MVNVAVAVSSCCCGCDSAVACKSLTSATSSATFVAKHLQESLQKVGLFLHNILSHLSHLKRQSWHRSKPQHLQRATDPLIPHLLHIIGFGAGLRSTRSGRCFSSAIARCASRHFFLPNGLSFPSKASEAPPHDV